MEQPIKELRTAFLDARRDLAKDTLESYSYSLQSFVDFAKNRIQSIDDITEDMLKRYTAHLRTTKKCSATSIQQYVTILKLMLRWADHHVKYTYRMPSKDKKVIKLKRMNRWFTEEDVKRCLEYQFHVFHNRNHLMVRLMIETGARVREIAQVETRDINAVKCTARIRESKTEPRTVFYSQETGKVFGLVIKDIKNAKMKGKDIKHIKIFPSVKQMKRIVSDMLIDLGLKNTKDGRGPHTFRHYCATYLHYMGGLSISDIGFLLGDTPDMIRSRYLHPTPEMLQGRMDQVWQRG